MYLKKNKSYFAPSTTVVNEMIISAKQYDRGPRIVYRDEIIIAVMISYHPKPITVVDLVDNNVYDERNKIVNKRVTQLRDLLENCRPGHSYNLSYANLHNIIKNQDLVIYTKLNEFFSRKNNKFEMIRIVCKEDFKKVYKRFDK